MRRSVYAFVLAVLALWPGFAFAAIIGPNDDWKPLRQGARELGISDRMVRRIIAAGLEVSCPGTVHDNGGTLNGWLLGGDVSSFYTNAHAVIDLGRQDHKSNLIEPLDECSVRSYRDLASTGGFHPVSMPEDRRQLQVASFNPQQDSPVMDRAHLRLLHSIAGTQALALPDFSRIKLGVGQEVIMVSLKPPHMKDAEIQSCHIQSLNLGGMGPGQLFTDCDNAAGNSAGLYFVRDPTDPSMLLPIALHNGCYDRLGDHQAWDRNRNTAMAIMLSRGFFSFGGRS